MYWYDNMYWYFLSRLSYGPIVWCYYYNKKRSKKYRPFAGL